MTAWACARAAKLIFWDFDGVIKDSVDVKTRAFVHLFAPYGQHVAEQVRAHHEAHGGMPRFEKIPVYLRLAGEEPTDALVVELCERFGDLVRRRVIDSPWVPGVEEYLRRNPDQQVFVLVSATPEDDLKQILEALDLRACFKDVFGAPTSKKEAIRLTLRRYHICPEDSLMIGDAIEDMDAAYANDLAFLLRRHSTNSRAFADYDGPSIVDLAGL